MWKDMREKEDKKPKKDRNCIRCEKFFDCSGKDEGKMCLQFKERKGK
jgi:hypothetical protein